jgi:uncharacterized protein (DUF4213/DUF364 family)
LELTLKLYKHFANKAASARIAMVSVGLGYTAVVTEDGGIGLSYTYFESKQSCGYKRDYIDWEGRSAEGMLAYLNGSDTIRRSMALALVNALNYSFACKLPEDDDNDILFETLSIKRDTRVAMVGLIKPIAKRCENLGAKVMVLDSNHDIGQPKEFYQQLNRHVDVLIMTSTTILNHTTEEILCHAAPSIKTVIIGPGTPMVAEVFSMLPVDMLAGTVLVDQEKVLQAVRHGAGTPVIQRYGRKVHLKLNKKW